MIKISNIQKIKEDIIKAYKILYGPILSIFLYSCAIIAFYFSVVGGRYFVPLVLIVGSFNFVYSIIYFLNKGRKSSNLEEFYKPEVFQPYRRRQKKILFLEIFIITVVLISPLFIVGGSYLIGDEEAEIQGIVLDLIEGCTNDTEKVNVILKWFNRDDNGPENFSSIYHRKFEEKSVLLYLNIPYIDCFYFSEYPHIGVRYESLNNNPHWIITTRCGMCGEQAVLFAEMGRIAGLNMSHVHCIPEDHAWNEVYIEGRGEPLIIDATTIKLPDSTGYKSVEFMQQKIARNWVDYSESPKEGNISFVYSKFPNDSKKYNVTHRYTDIINITVNVTNSNDKPVSNVMVKVISYNRPGVSRRSCWGLEKSTNEQGQCTFTLGGGRYKFELQRDGDWFSIETDVEWFWEGEDQQYYNVVYKSKTITDVLFENPQIIIIVVILCLWGVNRYFEKRKNNSQNDNNDKK